MEWFTFWFTQNTTTSIEKFISMFPNLLRSLPSCLWASSKFVWSFNKYYCDRRDIPKGSVSIIRVVSFIRSSSVFNVGVLSNAQVRTSLGEVEQHFELPLQKQINFRDVTSWSKAIKRSHGVIPFDKWFLIMIPTVVPYCRFLSLSPLQRGLLSKRNILLILFTNLKYSTIFEFEHTRKILYFRSRNDMRSRKTFLSVRRCRNFHEK